MAEQQTTYKYVTVKELASMIKEQLKTKSIVEISNIALKSKVKHGVEFLNSNDSDVKCVFVDYDKFKDTKADCGTKIRIIFTNCQLCDARLTMTSYCGNNSISVSYDNCSVLRFDYDISDGNRDVYFSGCKVQNVRFSFALPNSKYKNEYMFDDNTTCEYCVFNSCYGRYITHGNNEKFIHCSFRNCNFTRCDLTGVTFTDCKADVRTTGYYQVCPEKGEYTAFKKAIVVTNNKGKTVTTQYQNNKYHGKTIFNYVIVELKIPADAKRSSATTRKCRASKAEVISITSIDGKKKYKKALAAHSQSFAYEVGKTVIPHNGFSKDRWAECAPGIHHFITRREAVDYTF